MSCLCETCVHSDTNDTKEKPLANTTYTTYFCCNEVIAKGKLDFDGYYCAEVCSEYEEEHMESFSVGDKVTIVDAQALFPRYKEGDTAVVTGVCPSGVDLEMYDGCPQYASFERVKLTPSCIKDIYCCLTDENTCCFECSKYDECMDSGVNICDFDKCSKYKDYDEELKDEPCDTCGEPKECPMCTLEDKLADALEEISDLKEELLMDKQMIIELQRELLEVRKEPQVWQ